MKLNNLTPSPNYLPCTISISPKEREALIVALSETVLHQHNEYRTAGCSLCRMLWLLKSHAPSPLEDIPGGL